MYEIEWFIRHFLCMKLSDLSVTFDVWNWVIYPSLFMYEIKWFIRHFLCMKLSDLSVTFYVMKLSDLSVKIEVNS